MMLLSDARLGATRKGGSFFVSYGVIFIKDCISEKDFFLSLHLGELLVIGHLTETQGSIGLQAICTPFLYSWASTWDVLPFLSN